MLPHYRHQVVELGALIRARRFASRLTQDAVAARIMMYVGQSQLSAFERGEVDLPYTKLRAVLNTLGLDFALVELDNHDEATT